MNLTSIHQYLRHYGKIKTLRASVIRSTFKRVQAGFDLPTPLALETAMQDLEQANPEQLRCVYCGVEATCWDHLIPAARGGTHQIRNLAPSCGNCNLVKGVKTWQEFLDDQQETEATCEARRILERYTQDFVPKTSCLSAETADHLARICDDIVEKMAEADALIAKDLALRSERDA